MYFAMGIRGVAVPMEAYAKVRVGAITFRNIEISPSRWHHSLIPTRHPPQIEKAAREEVLACGGSLSHHHGVGQSRAEFLRNPRLTSPALLESLRGVKRSIDPQNTFGARNNVMAD